MKNLIFKVLGTFCLLLLSTVAFCQNSNKSYGDYYQISVYHTASQAQTDSLSDYLKTEYVPQLHKAGFSKVGVFMPLTNDTSADKKIVVWIPLKSINNVQQLSLYNTAPKYKRLENILLTAFEDAPHYKLPVLNGNKADHIYELRSYEGATEERYMKKVEMFNAGGEIKIFASLGFNTVFNASVIAGSHMPNLMYMTSFDNMETHNAHWKAFSDNPEWKRLSGLPEYQKTVSKADIWLMHAASYSDL